MSRIVYIVKDFKGNEIDKLPCFEENKQIAYNYLTKKYSLLRYKIIEI